MCLGFYLSSVLFGCCFAEDISLVVDHKEMRVISERTRALYPFSKPLSLLFTR